MTFAQAAAMTVEPDWHRSHLAVPRADGTLLAIPALDDAAAAARANAERLDSCDADLQGRPLNRLRQWARSEAVRLAKDFTSGPLGDSVAVADPTAPLIVPGHQPALYHPGVWAKNFASAGLARRLGGAVVNLVVDNDIYARPAIDVPAGTRREPRRESIAFDVPQRARPWEGTRVGDADLFASFGSRAASRMRPWGVEPLIAEFWRDAKDRLAFGDDLPTCLTALRHAIEASWGLHNLELRMSDLCESDPFLWFAGHVLAQAPRFADVYNGVLNDYRRIYHLKSKNHPVPALETRDEWIEAPFWVWREDAPHRRRVFSRQSGNRTTLADDAGHVFATLPLSPSMDACCAVEVLRDLPAQGVRFRTRALTTTLFARLFLADTFVHGIGGAKYDEMTDRIIARFFGVEPPAYATVSASLSLPIAEPFDATAEDDRRLAGLLRDLDQNPQRHLSRGADLKTDQLLDEKALLVAEQDAAWSVRGRSKRERRERSAENARRFRRLQEVTNELAALTAGQRERVLDELIDIRDARKANRILTSREFSFALYPESKLRPFLTALT